MEGKKEKYKIRTMPLSLYFLPCEDEKGNKWFDISFNGAGYPTIEEVERAKQSLLLLLDKMNKIGQNNLDKINKEIEKENIKEMMNWKSSNERLKKQPEKGYIYLLKSRNLYKIGRAKVPVSRIKVYRTENPFGIRVILQKYVDDYVRMEASLLDTFKDKKVRGEWFKLNEKDILWIKLNI